MTRHDSASTAAVVVGFNPDIAVLSRLLKTLSLQVDALILVDNGGSGSLNELEEFRKVNLIYLNLEGNKGLGAALNVGIGVAIERGAEFVALFDQDSAPPGQLISKLLESHRRLAESGVDCAAVSPVFFDRREDTKNYFPFYREIDGKITSTYPSNSTERLVPADTLITSGMLVKAKVWKEGGTFDEGIFVDYTDTEWCFRVRHQGHVLYGNLDIEMGHAPSDAPPARLAGFSFFRYSPVRRYYYFRNTIFFLLSDTASFVWKKRIATGLCLRFIVNIFIDREKWKSFKMMILGIRDGFRRKSGKWIPVDQRDRS